MPLLFLLVLLFGSNFLLTGSLVYFPLSLFNLFASVFPTIALVFFVGLIAWCFGND